MTVIDRRVPAIRRAPAARAFAAEWRRLRGDFLPWAFLPLALLSALSLAASLPTDLRSAPPAVIDIVGAGLRESLFGGLLMIAAVLGALGITLADRAGVLAREQVFTSPILSFASRAASSAIASAFFGAFGVAVVQTVFLTLSGAPLLTLTTAMTATAATAGAGLWGYLVGILIRSPILVLFVVPATLMPALVLVDLLPDVAAVLPLPALLAAAGVSGAKRVGTGEGIAVSLVWLVALAVVAVIVLRRRDRL
ncbi:hypothetical protein [Microbacterium sp. PMB16]|uniref:hypothetical protein n=1 Tax=Microbacterium sp. PMB16 TaxID=3120157 RepID=UPI003F4B49F6